MKYDVGLHEFANALSSMSIRCPEFLRYAAEWTHTGNWEILARKAHKVLNTVTQFQIINMADVVISSRLGIAMDLDLISIRIQTKFLGDYFSVFIIFHNISIALK